MVLASAMAFLRAAREDSELAGRLRAIDPADGLEPVVRAAAEAGFELTAEQLRAAYAHDWALRRMRYSTTASAPSTVAVVNSASSST